MNISFSPLYFSKKNLWLLSFILVFLCSIIFIYIYNSNKINSHLFSKSASPRQFLTLSEAQKYLTDHQIITAQINYQNSSNIDIFTPLSLNLEIVKTNASITQGLSDRNEIGADGMLFLFPSPTQPTFWMKNMRFNLDLVWINEGGEIVGFATNLPAPDPNTPLNQLPRYLAPQVVSAVLELPAGQVQNLNLQIGNQLMISIP